MNEILSISQINNGTEKTFEENLLEEDSIPSYVADEEKVVRIIYAPSHLTTTQDRLKYNAFRSPGGIDEVSVTRLKYSSTDSCKKQGKKHQNEKRAYFGLAVIDVKELRDLAADVIHSPNNDNLAHSDIKINFVCEKGEPLPPEIKEKLENIARKARLYKDTNPNHEQWIDGSIT